MDVPGIVRERLGDERRMTSVNIGGDDRVYVTPPRTLIYHSAGLFSRESIEEFSHDARRFDVSADRREASFAFEYDDGVRGFSVPRERIETVLPPVLAGVLRTTGLIDTDEDIKESYRFGERTLVVTETRMLTSVGEAIWDRDHESYAYGDVTGLTFDGDALRIEGDGRSRRLELPGDGQREAYQTLEDALLAYHGVASVEELDTQSAGQRHRDSRTDDHTSESEWGAPGGETPELDEPTVGIENAESEREHETEPRTGSPPPSSPAASGQSSDPIREASESTAEPDTPVESAGPTERAAPERAGTTATPDHTESNETTEFAAELDALRETVERQSELIERQQESIERLLEELSYDQ